MFLANRKQPVLTRPYGDQMPAPLLTTPELAQRLRVSARTLNRWRQEGWIRPELVTVGGQARWVEADVREQLRLLAEQRRERDEQD